jgi:hypothetical protein
MGCNIKIFYSMWNFGLTAVELLMSNFMSVS